MNRCLLWSTVLLLSLTTWPSQAETGTDDDLRATVEAMLGGFEKEGAANDWAALGEAAVPHLLAIVRDESQPRSTRARAVAATGHFATAEVEAMLVELLQPGGDRTLQRKALGALARTSGADHVSLMAAFLRVDDTVLREAAARALGHVATDEARQALARRRDQEPSATVRTAIDEELAR